MRGTLAFCGLFALVACKGKVDRVVPAAEAATGTGAQTRSAPVDAGAAATCPVPAAAKLAPFDVDTRVVATPVPKLEDPSASLASFEDKLLALARGTSKRTLRIGFYGDSNLTSDFLTAHLRRSLQARFGDAGHGYVGLARPWAWYIHEDVKHGGTWPMWRQFDSTTDPVVGHRYGFANMAAESSKPGAAAWASTAAEGAKVGTKASRFEVYFLKQPHGGTFDIFFDGKLHKTVSSVASDFEAGFEAIEAPDGPHEVKCVLKGDQSVRLYGTTLERDPSADGANEKEGGIVVDSLGAGAMNFQRWMLTEPVIRKAQLERRNYDLVFVWLGMNSMWLEPNHAWATDTIKTLRAAIPDVPVVLVSPPDSEKYGSQKTDPRIMSLVKQLREVAGENNAAFWDFRAAMGGDGAFLEFMKRGLAANDRVHLSREGGILMGQRLLAALFEDTQARLAAHPEAGCTPRAAPAGEGADEGRR